MVQLLTSVFSFCVSRKCKLIENLSAGCGSDDGFFFTNQWWWWWWRPVATDHTEYLCILGISKPNYSWHGQCNVFLSTPCHLLPELLLLQLGKGSEIALCGTFSFRGSAHRLHLRLWPFLRREILKITIRRKKINKGFRPLRENV